MIGDTTEDKGGVADQIFKRMAERRNCSGHGRSATSFVTLRWQAAKSPPGGIGVETTVLFIRKFRRGDQEPFRRLES